MVRSHGDTGNGYFVCRCDTSLYRRHHAVEMLPLGSSCYCSALVYRGWHFAFVRGGSGDDDAAFAYPWLSFQPLAPPVAVAVSNTPHNVCVDRRMAPPAAIVTSPSRTVHRQDSVGASAPPPSRPLLLTCCSACRAVSGSDSDVGPSPPFLCGETLPLSIFLWPASSLSFPLADALLAVVNASPAPTDRSPAAAGCATAPPLPSPFAGVLLTPEPHPPALTGCLRAARGVVPPSLLPSLVDGALLSWTSLPLPQLPVRRCTISPTLLPPVLTGRLPAAAGAILPYSLPLPFADRLLTAVLQHPAFTIDRRVTLLAAPLLVRWGTTQTEVASTGAYRPVNSGGGRATLPPPLIIIRWCSAAANALLRFSSCWLVASSGGDTTPLSRFSFAVLPHHF